MSNDPSTPAAISNAVANEVVSSAVRILSLLDLDSRQIAELFLAAANELIDGAEFDLSIPVHDIGDDDDGDEAAPWKLDSLAESEGFSKEIDRFGKRVSALRTDREPGPGEVQKVADLCLGVIPALAAAQRWYEEHCAAHRLAFAISQDEWRASATDAMLDQEHEVVFFDQLPFWHELHILESVARDCQRLALAEPVTQILDTIKEENLQVPRWSLQTLQQYRDGAAQYTAMLELLDRLVPGSETPRSELVNAISRDLPVKIESWVIEAWLTLAAEAGQIELYKKSNRWQVCKPPVSR